MQLNKKIKSIINDYKEILLKTYGDDIQSLVLFGSQARGTSNKDSDLDFIIVTKNDFDWKYEKDLSDLTYLIELKYGVFLDAHLISLNQLNNTIKGKDPLFVNALKNGVYA